MVFRPLHPMSLLAMLYLVGLPLSITALIPIEYNFNVEAIEEIPQTRHIIPEKEWTVIIEVAADNDLRGFAAQNIKQMAAIGSNDLVNIIVELHIRFSANNKVTRRYLIEQGKILHMNADDPTTQKMDSGDPQTFISFCSWALKHYPSKHVAVIFWDHGTGIIDPTGGRILHATELFSFNPRTNKLELNRSIGYLDFISLYAQEQRGICWDDSTGNYLTNQKLVHALDVACNQHHKGKKFDIIGFDACLMSMLEVGDLVKDYADLMVSSQEVELATGWNWELILAKFKEPEAPTPVEFAQHIVQMYEKTFNKITSDYTLSALRLDTIPTLSAQMHRLAELLLDGLHSKHANIIKNMIKTSRDKLNCTHFDEPSYIDLHHFCKNLEMNAEKIERNNSGEELIEHLKAVKQTAKTAEGILESMIIENTTSRNLSQAKGLSVYFPERKIHASYAKTPFAQQNAWSDFIHYYLLGY